VAELTSARAEELLEAASRIRALVVGDLMVDRYVSGSVERVSPEAPVPVVRVESERSAIGGAGNVAANVAALGASCVAVGCLGDDAAGRTLQTGLEKLGVGTEGLVVTPARPTTVKTRVMARHQQIVRFDHEDESDVDEAVEGQLAAKIDSLAGSADVLILEDYNKGVLVPGVIDVALAAASRHGLPSIVDPKRRNFFGFEGVTVFKPNAKELEDALGDFIHPDDAAWMEATRLRLGCEVLLLTLGERGVAVQREGSGHLRVPAVARSVYDVSGAGDTVTAVVASVLAAGGSASEAAVLANHAAAVGIGRSGVTPVTRTDILDHVADSI
jgi:rfaE bifunctional protein kinase chain/domain